MELVLHSYSILALDIIACSIIVLCMNFENNYNNHRICKTFVRLSKVRFNSQLVEKNWCWNTKELHNILIKMFKYSYDEFVT